MGIDVDLECENNFQEEPRPKIVRPCFRSRSKLEERDIKGKRTSRYCHLNSLDVGFEELSLCNSPSPHRKSMPSRPPRVNVEDNLVLKRGSVYQSSSEVRRMRKLKEGRTKKSAYTDEAFLSFEIVDSLPQTCRKDAILSSQQKQSPLGSLSAQPKSPYVDTTHLIPKKSVELLDLSFCEIPGKQPNLSSSRSGCVFAESSSAESLLEICMQSNDTECSCASLASGLVEKGSIEEPKSSCNQMFCPENDGNMLHERDNIHTLPKSFSEKVRMFDSPGKSERDILKASPKTRFSPLKRMLDPIMKSKSQRNPSLNTGADAASIIRNGAFRKSLLKDFSKVTPKMEYDTRLIVSDQVLTTRSSPAHLHAVLKLEFKHGAPSFEFAVKDLEDILSAKTWRTDSAFSWAYTFHSCKRKSNSSSRGTKDRHGPSLPVVGQMQVSCYLCSEVSENGSLENYMATEFILYDIAQARRSFAAEERSYCPSETIQPPTVTVSESLVAGSPSEANSSIETQKYQHSVRRTSSDCDSDPSTSHPWSPEDLHPHLEIAAIVIQIPFKKEKLRDTQMEEMGAKGNTNLSSVSGFDHGRNTKPNSLNTAVVKVVTPSGTHGLPSTEESGPSSLLDRWRFGGGCDCGGWDMSCPIVVFDNPCGDLVDYSIKGSQQLAVLFIQGRKEKVPALSITADGKGQYLVDFHAQLSAVQAFSICIAVLHSSEASSSVSQESTRQRLYSNSLELLLEEEVRNLIEVVAEEENRKAKKRVEQIPPSFFLDRPFSPMGRV